MSDRASWLKERQTIIGGTDASAIVGLNRYRSPLDCYLSKVEEYQPSDNIDMYRGRILEDAVRRFYCDATGLAVEKPSGILRHEEFKFIGGSLDGIASGNIVVELKTSRNRGEWGEPGTDEVPQEYLVQATHYLLVTGFSVCEIAVLFSNFDFQIYSIQRDQELVDMLLEREREFWGRIMRRDPPEPISSADSLKLWPRARQKAALAVDGQMANWLAYLVNARTEIEHWTLTKDNIESQIKAEMADNELLTVAGRTVASWSNVAGRRTLDAKSLQAEMPEIYAKYLRQGPPSRRFSLKSDVINELLAEAHDVRPVGRIEDTADIR